MNIESGELRYGKYYLISIIVLLPCFLLPFLIDDTLHPRFLMWSVISMVFLVLNYSLFTKANQAIFFKPLFLILFTFCSWIIITAAFANNPAESLLNFFKTVLILFTAAAFVLLQESMPDFFQVILKLLVAISCILGFVMLYEIFTEHIDFTNYKSLIKITSLNGNKNLFVEFMLMCLPFSWLSLIRLKGNWKYFAWIGFSFIVFALVFLQTRSVWVTIVLLLLMCLCYHKKIRSTDFFLQQKKRIGIFIAVAASIILSVLLIDTGIKNSIIKRASSIIELNENGSATGRLVLWKKTLNLVYENPVTGVGSGNWKIEFQKFGQQHFANVFNVKPMNDYVLVLAETGIPGLILFLSFLLLTFCCLHRLIRKESDTNKRRNHFVVQSSLVAFMAVSFFSYTNERSENLILLSLFLGYTSYNYKLLFKRQAKDAHCKQGKLITGAFVLLLFCSIVFFSFKVHGDYFNFKIQLARKHQHHAEVIKYAGKAQSIFYNVDETTTPMKWYSGVSKFVLQDTTAIKDFEEAYRVNPYHIHVLNNLATAWDHAGYRNRAKYFYKKAITISPQFNDAIFNLTVVYLDENNFAEADKTIKHWKGRKTEKVLYVKKLIDEKLGRKKIKEKKLKHKKVKTKSNKPAG